MAQPARSRPLPGSGNERKDSTEWLHDLTPTLSDEAMFDEEGHVQPLQVWPTESEGQKPRHGLRLVKDDESPADEAREKRTQKADRL